MASFLLKCLFTILVGRLLKNETRGYLCWGKELDRNFFLVSELRSSRACSDW